MSNELEVFICKVDANGVPDFSQKMLGSSLVYANNPARNINDSDITSRKFYSWGISEELPATKYCVVAREFVENGKTPTFKWVGGVQKDPYIGDKTWITHVTIDPIINDWVALDDKDMFFRFYFNDANVAILTTNTIVFNSATQIRNCKISGGTLTTDMKLAAIIIVDDSYSMTSSEDFNDPTYTYNQRISAKISKILYLINTLATRTNYDVLNTVANSYYDIWTYGVDIKELTSGFDWDLTNMSITLQSLINRGANSVLGEAASRAIGGMQYQSLIDAKFGENHTVVAADTQWAIEHIPLIFIISDGDNAEGSAENAAIVANSAWDSDGVQSFCFGWGDTNKQKDLRTIADLTDGKFFNLNTMLIDVQHTATMQQSPANTITHNLHGLSDGDIVYFTTNSPSKNILANIAYKVDNVALNTFTLTTLSDTPVTLTVADNGQSIIYVIADDWAQSISSLLHGQTNNIFKGTWSKNIDFDNPTWIKEINATYSNDCEILVRVTEDRFTWSNWQKVMSALPLSINVLIYGIEIKIILIDGWNGNPIIPVVTNLSYTTITPSIKYYVSNRQTNTGMMLEYLFTSSDNLPKTAKMIWGICRGDSVDFNNFEHIYEGRNSTLSNRQSGIRYTDISARDKLPCTLINAVTQTYLVNEPNGQSALWDENDVLTVIIKTGAEELALPQGSNQFQFYGDGVNSTLTIITPIDTTNTDLSLTIITRSSLEIFDGELTYTYDNRTYYATNGKWNDDAQAIPLLYNFSTGEMDPITDSNYWVYPEEGYIAFEQERNDSDLISIYIKHSEFYRLGVQLYNYDEIVPVQLDAAGLYFTEIPHNANIIDKNKLVVAPTLSKCNIKSEISGTTDHCSVYERLVVDYELNPINSVDSGTIIRWFLNGTELSSYYNRLTQPKSDVWITTQQKGPFEPGDSVYITVTPSNGIAIGEIYSTIDTPIVIDSAGLPIAYNLSIFSSGFYIENSINYIKPSSELKAIFTFNDGNNNNGSTINKSIITWFLNETEYSSNVYIVGDTNTFTVPSGIINSGQTWQFSIQPIIEIGALTKTGYTITSDTVDIKTPA